MDLKRVLVTGGAGFAGSHIVRHLLAAGYAVVCLDALTYAGRLDRLADLRGGRLSFVHCDFGQPLSSETLKQIGEVYGVIHNGAESHVVRSLKTPGDFVRSNAIGTFNMLEAARSLSPDKFVYISTDEVFGPAQAQPFKEDDPLRPSNPYSATKAAGEMLVRAYAKSFGVPAVITRTANMFGPMQHAEKFIPKAIRAILASQTVQIHCQAHKLIMGLSGQSQTFVSGERQWLYVGNQASAVQFILEVGAAGDVYQIPGVTKSNIKIAIMLSEALGLRESLRTEFVDVFSDHAGHDFSYSISGDKLLAKGWKPTYDFEYGLAHTARWSRDHSEWLND